MDEFLGLFPGLGVAIRSSVLESLRSLHALDTIEGKGSLEETNWPGSRNLSSREYPKKQQWLRQQAEIAARHHEH